MRVKVDDMVEVITGDDKGQRGKVLAVDGQTRKVLIEGVNRVYKHVRRSQKNPQGGRLSKEMPVPVSNVMVVCPKTNETTKVGLRYLEDGSKERFARKSGVSLGVISPARPAYGKSS